MRSYATHNPEALSYTYTTQGLVKRKGVNKVVAAFTLSVVILILVSVFIQLYFMSIYATKGTKVQKLETQKNQLVEENSKLRKQIAETKTLQYAEEKLDIEGNFEQLTEDNINYLEIDEGEDYTQN